MGGKVPAEEMTEDRLLIMAEVEEMIVTSKGRTARDRKVTLLLKRLYPYLETCPRIGCATCSFMAKHEAAQHHQEVST